MKCPFTYKQLKAGEQIYSREGLKSLNKKLETLKIFSYDSREQKRMAQKMAAKLSIQGVQPKLSVRLNVKEACFELCEKGGTYIVKPQVDSYRHLPENEDLTMKLAKLAKIETPWHGLILSKDKSYSYIIKRFDRIGKNKKLAIEDFGQLIGASRTTKYLASMKCIAEVIEEFCTYPTVEGRKLFRRLVFSFLIGNEDLHVKNLSLITRNQKIELSPAYDLVNSTMALAAPEEELALELNGKKRGITLEDFEKYGTENLYLTEKVINSEVQQLLSLQNQWIQKIDASYLDEDEKIAYKKIMLERCERLKK